MHFDGDRDFSLAPERLWAKLSDARFLITCIPDVTAITLSEPLSAQCKIRPGFSFVRGTLELTLRVAEAVAGQVVRLEIATKGIGTTSAVGALLTFAAQGQGTRVHWEAEVKELGGLLKAVPQGLVRAAAQKVIADAWQGVENQVNS